MTPLVKFLIADVAMFALAVYAWIADHRRQRRRNIDRIGVVNWVAVFVFAILLLLFSVILTLKVWIGG